MAAENSESISIVLIYGASKHNLKLRLSESDDEGCLTVRHVAREAERVTQVPVSNQKLIHRGKSLNDKDLSLSSLKITNGSKIMLIGRKVDSEDDVNVKAIQLVEKEVAVTEKKLSEIIHEVDGIHRGFLAEDLQRDALTKLARRLASCAEEFTKQLEKLDSLSLSDSIQDVRTKRKNLVSRIQASLDRTDSTQSEVSKLSDT